MRDGGSQEQARTFSGPVTKSRHRTYQGTVYVLDTPAGRPWDRCKTFLRFSMLANSGSERVNGSKESLVPALVGPLNQRHRIQWYQLFFFFYLTLRIVQFSLILLPPRRPGKDGGCSVLVSEMEVLGQMSYLVTA